MITAVRIQNFKALSDSGWIDLKKINYIMGTNSSGKSSIGKALLFASNIFEQDTSKDDEIPFHIPLAIKDEYLGNFKVTCHDGASSFIISYKIELNHNSNYFLRNHNKYKKWFDNPFVAEFEFSGEAKEYECQLNYIRFIDFNLNEPIIQLSNYDISYKCKIFIKNLSNSGLGFDSIISYLSSSKILPQRYIDSFVKAILPFDKILLQISSIKDLVFEFDKTESRRRRLPWFAAIILAISNKGQKRSFLNIEELFHKKVTHKQTEDINHSEFKRLINAFNRKRSGFHDAITFDQMSKEQFDKRFGESFDYQDFITTYTQLFDPFMFLGDLLLSSFDSLMIFNGTLNHIGPTRNLAVREREIKRKNVDIWTQLYYEKRKTKKLTYVIKALENQHVQNIRFKDLWGKHFEVEVKGKSGKWRNLMDIGFGFGEILPVLLRCLDNWDKPWFSNSYIIIEEPEVHLHPKLAASVSNFLKNLINDYGVNVIIETHSEHTVLKHQLLIKNEPELAKKSQILFMERVWLGKNGNSHIHSVQFKENGQLLKNFPDDFFDLSWEHYKELMRV